MARNATGGVLTTVLTDGTRKFRLRFSVAGERQDLILHERPDCQCGCGRGWNERTARTELGNVQARVRAGVWKRPAPPAIPNPPDQIPTFHQYASTWLEAKREGTIGDKPLSTSTYSSYRTNLSLHLLPFFARYRLDQIDRQLCLAFKAHKLREAAELRQAIAAGAEIRDRRGRRVVPLSASSVRKLIDRLAAILDDAVEDELIDRNPARGKRMRVRIPKPNRSFFELDELAALIEAANDQDALPLIPSTELAGPSTRARVARLAVAGRLPAEIAVELGLERRPSASISDGSAPINRSGTSAGAQ